jgi:hypothetical protein
MEMHQSFNRQSTITLKKMILLCSTIFYKTNSSFNIFFPKIYSNATKENINLKLIQ